MYISSPDSLFRFLLFRPPASAEDALDAETDTPFVAEVLEIVAEEGPRSSAVKKVALEFTHSPQFLNHLVDAPLGPQLSSIIDGDPIDRAAQLLEVFNEHFELPPDQLMQQETFAETKQRLIESLLAIKFAKGIFPQSPSLQQGLRLIILMELIAESEVSDAKVAQTMKAAFTIASLESSLKEPVRDDSNLPSEPQKPAIPADDIRNAIVELKKVKRLGLFDFDKPTTQLADPPQKKISDHPLLNLTVNRNRSWFSSIFTGFRTNIYSNIEPDHLMNVLSPGISLNMQEDVNPSTYRPTTKAIDMLSKKTKNVLKTFQPEYDQVSIWTTANRLHQTLLGLNESNAINSPLMSIRFGEPSLTLGFGGFGIPRPGEWGEPSPIPTSSGKVKPAGVGDLLVVRQQIKCYEAEEVAHVENILRGTRKERNHRRLDVTEEFFSEEVETTRETEREFSTTERFELQDETSKTLKEDMSLQVGVTVSGSYGPSVSFSTSAQFDYNRMQEETSRHASSYSKDVVDRSVERLSERVKKRREQRFRREVEERNLQEFNNLTGSSNISGVYQWINKIYQAQVFNYGKRLMFDFVVPEPAAFLRHALFKGKEKTLPQPPETLDENANDLKEDNYAKLAARYGATGIEPPPLPYITVSEAYDEKQDGGTDGKRITKSAVITIPEGYKATDCIMDFGISKGGEWWFDVWVGRKKYQNKHNKSTVDRLHKDLNDETQSLPVGIHGGGVNAYTVVIEVLCEVTDTAMQKWRLQTFEKIYEAYRQRVREYDDAMAALEARTDEVAHLGRNPLNNRRTERTELKKSCISLLTEQQFDLFDAMQGPAADSFFIFGNNYPEMQFDEALAEGPYIRFFENAFEWEQMTYVFYPYFWGRKAQWLDRMLDQDVDPQFEEFLKAGAARCLAPVRPGFEEAVLHYLETGEIWDGADNPPEIGSPLYVSLVTEIKDRTDKVGDAIPVGEPWDVRIPTDLLHLRTDDQLPCWEKQEDGTWELVVETG